MNNSIMRRKGRRRASFILLSLIMTLIIVFSAGGICAFADNEAGSDTESAGVSFRQVHGSGYASVLYDNSNGLPTSESNVVVQTPDGFIWVGSYSGLVRYNGNEFYRYPSSTGITSVMSLFVDSGGGLWIGTNDSGVAYMKNEELTFFGKKDGLSSLSVRSIAEDKDGNIIIATTMGIAYIDKDMILHNIDEPQLNKEYVCWIEANKEKNIIYGVTLAGGYFTIENLRVSGYYGPEYNDFGVVSTIYPDPDNPGLVYLGTENSEIIVGNLKHKLENYSVISVAPHKNVNMIKQIDGKLWVCTDTGIGFIDETRSYTVLDNVPMSNSIDYIMTDHEKNLWFCSSRQGLMKIVDNRFTDIYELAGLPSMVVNTTCITDERDLYIGTDRGLYILDKDYKPLENELTEFFAESRIRCIKEDSNGMLWFCTYTDNGLVRYDRKTGKKVCFNESTGILSNRVRTVKELKNGNMAVATNAGLNIISGNKVIKSYGAGSGINNLEILSIEEDKDGRILLGSDGDGIYIIEGEKVSRLGVDDGLSSEVILRLKKDPKEEMFWIISSNSISYLKNGAIKNIGSFPYSNNFDIYFDKNDFAWVLSSNGIYVINRDDLLNNDEKLDYTLYDTNCGLPAVATANSFSGLSDKGELFISASSGVSVVNINDNEDDISNIKLAVSYVTGDDEYYFPNGDGVIFLPSDCKRINIYPNAFTYSLNNPHVSYYLEGFDDEPIEVTKQDMKVASYTNLRGGTYCFHLSIIDTMTGKAEKSISLTIIKPRAFYEMGLFWALISIATGTLVVIIIVSYFRRKTRELLRQQELNNKLINEMTAAFAKCVDSKDAYTNGHSFRVAAYSVIIAKRMGKTKDELAKIYRIALLHDIGKISIPDNILNKPGRLDNDEFAVMKSHAIRGYEILKDITIAPELAIGAKYHHERLDGCGYPDGLVGADIPEIAQIIAVADCFDAMYSTRPYRKKMELGDVIKEIRKGAGTHFNRGIVDVFIVLAKEGAFDREPDLNQIIDFT